MLENQPWNGNTRELKNLIDTVISLENTSYITPSILRGHITPSLPAYQYTDIPADKTLVPIDRHYQGNLGGFGDEMALIFKTLLKIQNDVNDVKREVNYISDRIDSIEDNGSKTNTPDFSDEEFHKRLSNYNLESLEKTMIELALNKFHGNRRMAAENLGISSRTLYRKISDYNLE